jgi:ribosomal protein L37AE/L43A
MRRFIGRIIRYFAHTAPSGAKCPKCGSLDIADSSDNYHWKCNSCGHSFTTMDIQY